MKKLTEYLESDNEEECLFKKKNGKEYLQIIQLKKLVKEKNSIK